MNKAMLCTLRRNNEEKNILISKNKIEAEASNLKIDLQKKDTNRAVQPLINSQAGQKLELDFLEGEGSWILSSKKMFISDFDYAYDLSTLNDFINSLIKIKINDREIDLEIIELLKNDIFAAADFWENENIDQDLTAELVLKYWDLEAVNSYPENDYYKMLLQFADGEIEIIDEQIAEHWFKIPLEVRDKINNLIEQGLIEFKNYSIYLKTRENVILNNILLHFVEEAAEESQESVNNLFEKFHYQLIDELTKFALEKDIKINLTPVIPHLSDQNEDLKLNSELELTDYTLIEVFNHYEVEIDFASLKLFSENTVSSLSDYLNALISHINYLNAVRKKLNCSSCGSRLDYDLDYLQETAAYKVVSARCNNLDCEKFDQEIDL